MSSKLLKFVDLIKGFRLSKALVTEARRLGFPLQLITTVAELKRVLMLRDWRKWPMLYDVPAGGQIFGAVALDSGIEGILYESILTGKECLAIFPQNFLNSPSHVELDDLAPSDDVVRRMDSSNFKSFL